MKTENNEELLPFKYDITSYGADFDVIGLVRRLNDNDIFIPPFQRQYVWTQTDASRFIESLLLGLPIPGVFLSKEQETNRLLVIDGQQRLRSVQYFVNGYFKDKNKDFTLIGVQKEFNGKTYQTLDREDRRKIDNSIIHTTIIEQTKPTDDKSSIYYIFERLNTTGKKLLDQEIRACIFSGAFIDLLSKLNQNKKWREMFGAKNNRMRDQEMILRFLSLYYNRKNYSKSMKFFLNSFLGNNRKLNIITSNEISTLFNNTIDCVYICLGTKAFKPKKSFVAALFDAVMIGIAERLKNDNQINKIRLKSVYKKLLEDSTFIDSISVGTSDRKKVIYRIDAAIKAFKTS